VTHTYNPSYSGGRVWEDHGSTPVQANSSQDPISKILNTPKKLGWWSCSSAECLPSKCEALNSNPSSAKKKMLQRSLEGTVPGLGLPEVY
jgi:hypothetical protein